MKRSGEAESTIQDDNNNIHHEHIGDASKSDVSPNTPLADEAGISFTNINRNESNIFLSS
jgi:hypothetical protein